MSETGKSKEAKYQVCTGCRSVYIDIDTLLLVPLRLMTTPPPDKILKIF